LSNNTSCLDGCMGGWLVVWATVIFPSCYCFKQGCILFHSSWKTSQVNHLEKLPKFSSFFLPIRSFSSFFIPFYPFSSFFLFSFCFFFPFSPFFFFYHLYNLKIFPNDLKKSPPPGGGIRNNIHPWKIVKHAWPWVYFLQD